MAAQNIRYAELTVTPYTSIVARDRRPRRSARPSRTPGSRAERELGIVLRWIFDIPGELRAAGAPS